MILDLRSVFINENKSISVNSDLDLSALQVYGGYPLKKPVSANGSVSNRAGVVTLNLVCKVIYSAPCDRCGQDTVKTYCIDLTRTLVNEIGNEENDEMLLISDFKLDLDDFIYSEVVLNLPTKHLCKEDCKGICEKCGKNLNNGECDCNKKEIDPRLAPLAELLK